MQYNRTETTHGENLVAIIGMSIAIVGLSWFACRMADSTINDYKGHKAAIQQNKQYMKDQNCKVTGFYGKHGQYKVFTCDDGKVWREGDLL